MAKIEVKQTSISILQINESDYVSLTDIARYKSDIKLLEFEGFKKFAGLNAFTMRNKNNITN
jgi:hypothetical protein